MKKVIIKVGGYGFRPDKKSAVRLITEKDGPISVSDDEADRIVGLEIAEYVVDDDLVKGHLDAGQFEDYSMKELQKLAKDMGLKANGSKEELIARITAEEVQASEEPDIEEPETEETDAEEPPVLEAVDPE